MLTCCYYFSQSTRLKYVLAFVFLFPFSNIYLLRHAMMGGDECFFSLSFLTVLLFLYRSVRLSWSILIIAGNYLIFFSLSINTTCNNPRIYVFQLLLLFSSMQCYTLFNGDIYAALFLYFHSYVDWHKVHNYTTHTVDVWITAQLNNELARLFSHATQRPVIIEIGHFILYFEYTVDRVHLLCGHLNLVLSASNRLCWLFIIMRLRFRLLVSNYDTYTARHAT